MQKKKIKNEKPKTLVMSILPNKTTYKELKSYIEEINNSSDLNVTYSYEDKVLNIKSKKQEYILYAKEYVDVINFLYGLKSGMLDFADVYMRLTPVGGKNESKN